MANKRFVLVANINTEDPTKIEEALSELVGVDAILRTEDGFRVKTTMEGVSAREMNRSFLSALRSVENKTTMRAEWTHDSTTERFFDYVPKGIRKD
ncbi:MAG: hypothetical protein M1587_02875 [Thaumarchaeota archaeon]|nr:hypothetical protein [Nitrososphaerota archaeon]